MLIACLLVGYLLGSFLTAEVVCRVVAHRSAFEVGEGNPGMASVGRELGAKAGACVLAGDILKTVAAWAAAQLLCPADAQVAGLLATLGATVGHNHPFWHRFRGGKGVATTCSAIILASPALGVTASLAGLAVVVLSGYLCWGALAIPVAFTLLTLATGAAPAVVVASAILAALMAKAHANAMSEALAGTRRRASISTKFWDRVRRR